MDLTFNEYQSVAMQLENPTTEAVKERFSRCRPILMIMMSGMGAWEMADSVKRYIYYGDEQQTASIDAALQRLDKALIPVDELSVCERTIRLTHGWLGFLSEVPEMAQAILNDDPVNIREESGDFKWYGALIDDANDDLSGGVGTANLEKLKQRYPDRFKEEDALNRNLDEEYAALVRVHCP